MAFGAPVEDFWEGLAPYFRSFFTDVVDYFVACLSDMSVSMSVYVCLCLFVCDGRFVHSWQVIGRKPWYAKVPDTVLVCRGAGDCAMLPVPKSWSKI